MTYKKLENEKNRYKFEVKVDYKEFESEREKTLNDLAKTVKIAGFRPGKAPKEAVEKEVGYKAYLDTVNKILPKAAIEVVEKENLNPLSSFNYDLKNLDKDKDVIFTFEFFNQPDIKAEDFKKIKVKYNEPKIAEGEVDVVIKNIIKSSLPKEKWEKSIKKVKKTSKTKESEKDKESKQDEDIEVTDELVKEIGYEDAKTYEEMKKNVEETLNRIKTEEADNEFASHVVEEAIKIADFGIPEELVEHEAEHKEEHFKERLRELKLDQNMYLKTQNTSLDDLRKTWKEEALNNLKSDLLLINLAVSENLTPSDEEVEKEIEKIEDPNLKERYKNNENNKNYLKTSITRVNGLKKLIEIAKK